MIDKLKKHIEDHIGQFFNVIDGIEIWYNGDKWLTRLNKTDEYVEDELLLNSIDKDTFTLYLRARITEHTACLYLLSEMLVGGKVIDAAIVGFRDFGKQLCKLIDETINPNVTRLK